MSIKYCLLSVIMAEGKVKLPAKDIPRTHAVWNSLRGKGIPNENKFMIHNNSYGNNSQCGKIRYTTRRTIRTPEKKKQYSEKDYKAAILKCMRYFFKNEVIRKVPNFMGQK